MAGGGLLRDTLSPPYNRGESLVRVVDTATLSQEEANDDIFHEIDSYPANPIALLLTDANQELPAGSSTHVIELPPGEGSVLQSASEQGEDSSALPITFTDSQLRDFKEYFSIPDEVGIKVPIEGESIMDPIVNERILRGLFVSDGLPYF
ncbi:hypothetical protein LIER_01791 [Lithospermum erythrorhizon]|uniref:Uncharacterized protein n=1 Tax=Lithospermum erythrorhizon TaxID=34254 RepID=A0AAV3NRY2_LITER